MESLVTAEAAAGAYTTPTEEFGRGWGSPARELLEEQLAEGQRAQAAKREKLQARDKERLADQMKKDLR